MQIANCWLVIDKRGSDVPRTGVTPAELVLLVKIHQDSIGRHPVHDLEIVGEARRLPSFDEQLDIERGGNLPNMPLRTSREERDRLRRRYGCLKGIKPPKYHVDDLFPGEMTPLPETFEETGLLVASQPAVKA